MIQDYLFDPNILLNTVWVGIKCKMKLFMNHFLSPTLAEVVFIIIHIVS